MKELALHILDIVENAVSAEATFISLQIKELNIDNLLQIKVEDNGKGMDNNTLTQVTNPFYTSRTTRKVGLGIPLFKQAAEQCEGSFKIASEIGKGTSVVAEFPINHIDRQPMGDLPGVWVQLLSSYPHISFHLKYKTDKDVFEISTDEIKASLDGMPLSELSIVKFLKQMIFENIQLIKS